MHGRSTGESTRYLSVAAVLLTLLAAVLLSGCSARNPVADVAAANVRCPDLTGSYCANGQQFESGGDQLTAAHLAWFLPLDGSAGEGTRQKVWGADRVDLAGGHDGQLTVSLFKAGEAVLSESLPAAAFRCGTDTLLMENQGEPWGGGMAGPLPVIAAGWSDAHSLFWKGTDGTLWVRKLRRNSGTVFLAIPVVMDDDFRARFRPVSQGCD